MLFINADNRHTVVSASVIGVVTLIIAACVLYYIRYEVQFYNRYDCVIWVDRTNATR